MNFRLVLLVWNEFQGAKGAISIPVHDDVSVNMKFHTHRFRVSKTTTSTVNSSNSKNFPNIEANTQACSRCRRLKKRCSKNPPECELCASAGHVCSLAHLAISPTDPTTSPNTISEDISTSTTTSVLREQGGVQSSPTRDVERQANNAATASTIDGTYLSYLHAYFRHVHRAYPFLDKQEILGFARASAYRNLWTDNSDSIVSVVCCFVCLESNVVQILGLVLAIGSTTLERAGKLSAYSRPGMVVPYVRILSRCLLSPSVKGLQILTLLSLYSLFDPKGISTWSIVGILTRQAITLGLSRTDTSLNAFSPHKEELRHRLFWSIFVLDRMLAVSVGHSAGLVDENANIPQPAVTVEEFASSERIEHASLLQLNRHIIQLRQLEQRILNSVHVKNQVEISNMSIVDRRAVSRQLRSAIDDWYSLGCLVCLPEADNIPIHSTITWLNARYYNLLILLYYPCQFNSQSKHNSAEDLISHIRKYFRYNHVLLDNKQLPLNYITLNRLIPACLVLLHCFGITQPANFSGKEELSNCIRILRAFPEDWLSAHQAANTASELLRVITGHESHATTQVVSCTEANTMSLSSTTKAELRRLSANFSQIIAKVLSPTSCYLSLCSWESSDSAASLVPCATETDTDSTTEQLNIWSLTDDYDFGFL